MSWEAPVRSCCGQRHAGVQCLDRRVRCCLCFERVTVEELRRNDDGDLEDVCASCGEAERREVQARADGRVPTMITDREWRVGDTYRTGDGNLWRVTRVESHPIGTIPWVVQVTERVRVELIGPERASRYLARSRLAPLINDARLRHLAGVVERGEWRMDSNPIRFNGDGQLVDGVHRLAAIVRTGITVEMAVLREEDAC